MPRLRTGVRRSGLRLQIVQEDRWGAVVVQGRWHFLNQLRRRARVLVDEHRAAAVLVVEHRASRVAVARQARDDVLAVDDAEGLPPAGRRRKWWGGGGASGGTVAGRWRERAARSKWVSEARHGAVSLFPARARPAKTSSKCAAKSELPTRGAPKV